MGSMIMKELEKIQNNASIGISKALQPLNIATAPFYIQLLRGYARELEKLFPGAGEVAEKLEETSDGHVIVTNFEK